MAIKAVLFDMDGTVLDTEPMYKKAWKSAFERAELEFSEELFNNCVGRSVTMIKQLINEHYNDAELFNKTFPMAAAWAAHYKSLNGVPVKKGFYELSDYLKANGIISIIATSTSHEAAVEDLTNSGIIGHFAGIIGGDDVENGKPCPDPYIKAAALAGVKVDECIAVEDSINGIKSAASAGVKCVYIMDFIDISSEAKGLVYKQVGSLDEVIGIIKAM